MPVRKRNLIYLALAVFISIGVVLDVIFWPYGASGMTWNDFVQLIGILFLAYWWQAEDAIVLGKERSTLSKVMTLLFVPAGLAIYLFQTREWPNALAALALFLGGIVAVAYLTGIAAFMLMFPGEAMQTL